MLYHCVQKVYRKKMRKQQNFCSSSGQLYTFRISRVFLQNTPQNTKHSQYTFRISCKFRVLWMPQKNKPRNPLASYTLIIKLTRMRKNISETREARSVLMAFRKPPRIKDEWNRQYCEKYIVIGLQSHEIVPEIVHEHVETWETISV